MQFRPGVLLKMFRDARQQSLSLRWKLAVWLIMLGCTLVVLVFFVFNLIGIVNPIERQIETMLFNQLDRTVSDIRHDTDDLAAWGISLSDQLSDTVANILQERRLSFDDLRNNPDLLNEIQQEAYNQIYTHMQLTTSSGAFYFLDTTVNDALPETYYNGLYLKYANLYAENTIHNKPCVFRGNSGVARRNSINLYSTWQLESMAGTFPQAEALLGAAVQSPARGYLLTEVYALPDSWEYVRLLCVPVLLNGRTIGVCGFEISDLYFRLVYPASNEQVPMICALLTETDGLWAGQLAGQHASTIDSAHVRFSIQNHGRFVQLSEGTEGFIGLMQEISVGTSQHRVAVMMPTRQYEQIVRESQIKTAAFLFVLMLLLIGACVFLSHRYVNPILRGLAQLKTEEAERQATRIPEIDDLFDFLSAKDRSHEAELARLHMENADVQRERERAETALSYLHAAVMQEVNQEAYALFCSNLCTLTPKEREVFDLYLQGRKGKEIQEILNISQNTLKYHNKNIYDKLGVSSRKELLKYATLMQKDAKEDGL